MPESTLLYNRKHQEKLASEVNATLHENAKHRRENRERQEGVEIPSRKPSSHNVVVEMPPSPAFGMRRSRSKEVPSQTSLSGAEKRRKRKGGSTRGGPGQKGAGMRPSTPRQRRGCLVKA